MPESKDIDSNLVFRGKLDDSLKEAINQATERLDKLGEKIKELPEGISEFGEKILELSGAAFLFDQIKDAIGELKSEWDELIKVGEEHLTMQSRLQVALENQPHLIRAGTNAIEEQKEAIEKFAQAQEKATTFGEAFTENLATRLTSLGITPEHGLQPLVKGFENELARRGVLSGTDADAQELESAIQAASMGRTKALAQMFRGIGLTEHSFAKGESFEDIITTLIKALEKQPDYAARNKGTAAGNVTDLTNAQKRLEEIKGDIAVDLAGPFDDFFAHLDSQLADGPLKWLEKQTEDWGKATDKWVRDTAIPVWSTFSQMFVDTVVPKLQDTGREIEKLLAKIGEDTGLSGVIKKIEGMKSEDLIKGIATAVGTLNDAIDKLSKDKAFNDMVESLSNLMKDVFNEKNINSAKHFFGELERDISNTAKALYLFDQGDLLGAAKAAYGDIHAGEKTGNAPDAFDKARETTVQKLHEFGDALEQATKPLNDGMIFNPTGGPTHTGAWVKMPGSLSSDSPVHGRSASPAGGGYSASIWDSYLESEEKKYNLQPGLLRAIARQENVSPGDLNPLGISPNGGGPTHFESMNSAQDAIERQVRLMTDPKGPYHDVRTKSIDDTARIYSPPGASNDVHGTNATESSGIKKNLKDLGSPNVSYNINISSDHDPQAISNALHGVLQDHANEIARHVSRVFRDDLQTQPA